MNPISTDFFYATALRFRPSRRSKPILLSIKILIAADFTKNQNTIIDIKPELTRPEQTNLMIKFSAE